MNDLRKVVFQDEVEQLCSTPQQASKAPYTKIVSENERLRKELKKVSIHIPYCHELLPGHLFPSRGACCSTHYIVLKNTLYTLSLHSINLYTYMCVHCS